jgi:hypothetical protein
VDGAIEGIDATGGVNQTEIMGAISLWCRASRPRARRGGA